MAGNEGDRPDKYSRIGHRIKVLRVERGMTAKEVAAAARIDPTTLSRIEAGKMDPRSSTLEKIVVRGLGAELSDL
ncbi:MAG: helix-turn-helix transcriptional regulator [Actinomycetota bacterium]|nr:helix-turn-helix transcriptional regulator [Actinomycetota bacterium]